MPTPDVHTRLRWWQRRQFARARQRHAHDTGILVAGRFSNVMLSLSRSGRWPGIAVVFELRDRPVRRGKTRTNAKPQTVQVQQMSPGPTWLALEPGATYEVVATVGFPPANGEERTFTIEAKEQSQHLLYFEPPHGNTPAAIELVSL